MSMHSHLSRCARSVVTSSGSFLVCDFRDVSRDGLFVVSREGRFFAELTMDDASARDEPESVPTASESDGGRGPLR
jgi:hypothetical protein